MAPDGFLIDSSAINRVAKNAGVAERIKDCFDSGLGYTCAILDLEALWSSRSPADYVAIAKYRNGVFRWAETDDRAMQRALEVQGILASKSMIRAVGLADLIIAAVAEINALTILHYDSDFDHIASITSQPCEWVVARGSVP